MRVSEDFRVIALGLPVPRYHGNPLDPPLRSRFQARDIHLLPFKVCSWVERLTLRLKGGPTAKKLNGYTVKTSSQQTLISLECREKFVLANCQGKHEKMSGRESAPSRGE